MLAELSEELRTIRFIVAWPGRAPPAPTSFTLSGKSERPGGDVSARMHGPHRASASRGSNLG